MRGDEDICFGDCMVAGHAGVDAGVSVGLELVVGFCCLVGMLGVDSGADAAVGARVWVGWNDFRQLVPRTHTHTHTHNRFTAGLEYVRVHPGQQVPER